MFEEYLTENERLSLPFYIRSLKYFEDQVESLRDVDLHYLCDILEQKIQSVMWCIRARNDWDNVPKDLFHKYVQGIS